METFSNDLRLRTFPQLLSGAPGVLEESAGEGRGTIVAKEAPRPGAGGTVEGPGAAVSQA